MFSQKENSVLIFSNIVPNVIFSLFLKQSYNMIQKIQIIWTPFMVLSVIL